MENGVVQAFHKESEWQVKRANPSHVLPFPQERICLDGFPRPNHFHGGKGIDDRSWSSSPSSNRQKHYHMHPGVMGPLGWVPAQGNLHEAGVAVAEGYVGCVWGEEGSNGCQAVMCSRRFWAILIRGCDGTVAIWVLCMCVCVCVCVTFLVLGEH